MTELGPTITELEPTITELEPTATERLRALLTERGVEWRGGLPTETMVEADGLDLLYVALPDGRVRAFIRNYLTPEQAIEATLGGDLQAENEMLRELVARLICHIEDPPCEGCMAEMSCAGGEGLTNCDEYQFMVSDARKLGVDE